MDDKPATLHFNLKGCIRLVIALAIAYLFLIFTLSALIELAAASSWWAVRPSTADQRIGVRIASSVLIPILMCTVTLLLVRGYFPRESYGSMLAKFGLGKVGLKRTLLLSFFLGLTLILFLKLLMDIYPPESSATTRANAILSEAPFWAQLVYAINVCTLVPLAEEFIFRGVLYKGLQGSFNKVVAGTLVSVLFALAHFNGLVSGYWLSQTAVVVMPIVFIVARELTGSIYSSIFIHSGFNFGSVFIV